MKEVIWLRVSRSKVEGMYKSMPTLRRGEIPVKVTVEVSSDAFREPVLEQSIVITDWRDGLVIADVDLRELTITEAEAERLRLARLAEMVKVVREHGYDVTQREGQ